MTKPIYCISGLGADEKIFANLHIKGYELRYIPWIRPHKKEKIEGYAKRMMEYIKEDSAVLIGVSFGGMMGIEIAKQKPLHKLFIVSSIKSASELPRWMKAAGTLKLDKLLPTRLHRYTEKIDNSRLGVSTKEEKEMVRAYRKNADLVFVDWAISQILNWKNAWQPDNIIHIHGDKDKIFPVKKIHPTCIIKEGTHMMIYNRAGEIGEYIQKEL
ncbi:MAG TPA: alpha/beta hydrolase [Chitinophagaceae bacterium]